MKKRWLWLFLLVLVLLCGCAAPKAETLPLPAAPPANANSSHAAEEATPPAQTEPTMVEGCALEELGYTVVLPQHLLELQDPNHLEKSAPFFEVHTWEPISYAKRFYDGSSTVVELSVADNMFTYEPRSMRILQCYKLEELAAPNARVRLYDKYLDQTELEGYEIWRNDKIMICDLTDLEYAQGSIHDIPYHDFAGYATQASAVFDYDYSWMIPIYGELAQNILTMIYDADGNALYTPAQEPPAYQPDEAAAVLWAQLQGWWNGPKNRFVLFSTDEAGRLQLYTGLYDADGGRGFGTVTALTQNTDASFTLTVFYPEHPETEMMSYLPAETVQLTISGLTQTNLTLQGTNSHAGSYYRSGDSFDTAYQAYADLHHNW